MRNFRLALRRLRGSASPRDIPGLVAWYDLSDPRTRFQDRAGSAPLTDNGQSLALALDRKQNLHKGPDQKSLVQLLSFTGTPAYFDGSGYVIERNEGSTQNSYLSIDLIGWFEVTFTVEAISGPTGSLVSFRDGGSEVTSLGEGTFTLNCHFTSSVRWLAVVGRSLRIIIHSVRALPGNHLHQTNYAARPTYGTGVWPPSIRGDGVDNFLESFEPVPYRTVFLTISHAVLQSVVPLLGDAVGTIDSHYIHIANSTTMSLDGGSGAAGAGRFRVNDGVWSPVATNPSIAGINLFATAPIVITVEMSFLKTFNYLMHISNGTLFYANVRVYDMAVYDRVLTENEHRNLVSYFMKKVGII